MLHELNSHVSVDKITEQHLKEADFTSETAELQGGGVPEAETDCAEGEQDDSTYVPSVDGEDEASDISLDEYLDIVNGDSQLSEGEQPATLDTVRESPLNYSQQQSSSSSQPQCDTSMYSEASSSQQCESDMPHTQRREQCFEEAVTDIPEGASQDFSGSDKPRSDFEWQASGPGPHDVLMGVDPDPALRERVREGLRPSVGNTMESMSLISEDQLSM